jgi:hypothetical protein
VRNLVALYFLIEWARCGFHKKLSGTHYAELVFLRRPHLAVELGHEALSEVPPSSPLRFGAAAANVCAA